MLFLSRKLTTLLLSGLLVSNVSSANVGAAEELTQNNCNPTTLTGSDVLTTLKMWSNEGTKNHSSISLMIPDRRPVTTAAIAMTVATPITMPRIVRKARTLLERSASRAIPTPSRTASKFMRKAMRWGACPGHS